MRMMAFSKRCTKEILRDPLNLCFGPYETLGWRYVAQGIECHAPQLVVLLV